jgi:hypothetical protein
MTVDSTFAVSMRPQNPFKNFCMTIFLSKVIFSIKLCLNSFAYNETTFSLRPRNSLFLSLKPRNYEVDVFIRIPRCHWSLGSRFCSHNETMEVALKVSLKCAIWGDNFRRFECHSKRGGGTDWPIRIVSAPSPSPPRLLRYHWHGILGLKLSPLLKQSQWNCGSRFCGRIETGEADDFKQFSANSKPYSKRFSPQGHGGIVWWELKVENLEIKKERKNCNNWYQYVGILKTLTCYNIWRSRSCIKFCHKLHENFATSTFNAWDMSKEITSLYKNKIKYIFFVL